MVKYVKDNKTYTLNEIIKENPGRGFNEDLDLEEFGYVPLIIQDKPVFDIHTQMLSEVITGNQLSWDIVSLPDEYLKEEALSKAKAYLVSTDMKLMPYYDFDVGDLSLEEYVAERKVARDFIRSIEDS